MAGIGERMTLPTFKREYQMLVSNLMPMDVIKYNNEVSVVLEIDEIPHLINKWVGDTLTQVEAVNVLLGTETRQYWQVIELTEQLEVLDEDSEV